MALSNVSFTLEGRQCFCTISQTTAEPLTVYIGSYAKVITQQEQRINLTPYLLAQLSLSPERHNALDKGNAVQPAVTINGTTYYSEHAFVWGVRDVTNYKASDLPYRLISAGQTDYVCAFCDFGGRVNNPINGVSRAWEVNEATASSLMAIRYRAKEGDSVGVEVKNSDGDVVYAEPIVYSLRPMGLNGKRLAWVNKYGAMDFWNFDYLREQNFVASSEIIYTHNGYKKIGRTAEKVYVVETREATREAIDALSFIIASPAVWLVTDDLTGNPTFEEVDVITEECKVFDSEELLGLQIAYRPKKRVL